MGKGALNEGQGILQEDWLFLQGTIVSVILLTHFLHVWVLLVSFQIPYDDFHKEADETCAQLPITQHMLTQHPTPEKAQDSGHSENSRVTTTASVSAWWSFQEKTGL